MCAEARISARCCHHRTDSSSATNIVIESKYTAPPPAASENALVPSAAASPRATGTSIPTWPVRSWLKAARHSGAPQNSTTGTVSTAWATSSSCSSTGPISPGRAR